MKPSVLVITCLLFLAGTFNSRALELEEVLSSVRSQYPPLLAAWIQQDIVNGRARSAEGAFDPTLTAALQLRPMNYYEATNGEFLISQPLRQSGGTFYGGYRAATDDLPDYDRKIRTADGGEAVLGFRLPFLRDRRIDSRRATLEKAELDQELNRPIILRQHLDFLRAARITYFKWLAAGQQLRVAEEVLKIAEERESSINEKIKEGALPPISQVDNQNLVVTREIEVINANRKFEENSIALSLFHRNATSGEPIEAQRKDLPESFPKIRDIKQLDLVSDRGSAIVRRPEVRQLNLLIQKNSVDQRLAENNLKPNLDLAVELNQAIGGDRPTDIDRTETTARFGFSVPLGRNQAKGQIEAARAALAQLENDREFARERIITDTNDSYSAVKAAFYALDRSLINIQLAEELERAENEKFEQGVSDLLALQIREQATFSARKLEVEARFNYFKALADYLAAIAADAPPPPK